MLLSEISFDEQTLPQPHLLCKNNVYFINNRARETAMRGSNVSN